MRKEREKIRRYLSSSHSVITGVHCIDGYNDYPHFYQYQTTYLPLGPDANINLAANGIAFDADVAYVKAVMETLERWYWAAGEPVSKKQSYRTLRGANRLDPRLLSFFSKRQLRLKKYTHFNIDEDTLFSWTKVHLLFSREHILVPTELIYLDRDPPKNNPRLKLPDTSGLAAGSSLEQALYHGICELIERDAYTIFYYNKLPLQAIDLRNIESVKTKELIQNLKGYRFEVFVFDMTLDIKVPCVFCVLIDITDVGPKVTVGARCDLNAEEAVYGAIMESLQSLTSLRDVMQLLINPGSLKVVKKLFLQNPNLERLLFWTETRAFKELAFLDFNARINMNRIPTQSASADYKDKLKAVHEALRKNCIEQVLWKEISHSRLQRYGFFAVKVLIPDLQPFHLHKDHHCFGNERMYTVPVKLAYRKDRLAESELNNYPHPFP